MLYKLKAESNVPTRTPSPPHTHTSSPSLSNSNAPKLLKFAYAFISPKLFDMKQFKLFYSYQIIYNSRDIKFLVMAVLKRSRC